MINSVPQNEQGYVKAEEVVQALGVRDASGFEALIEAIVVDEHEEADTVKVQTDSLSHRASPYHPVRSRQQSLSFCRH